MTLVLLLTLATGAWADEQKVVLKVDPITVAKGTEAEIEVKMDYTAEKTLVGLSFSLYLPDGILLKGFDTKEAQDAARASALKNAFDIFYEEGIWGENGISAWLAVKPQVDGGLQITLIDQDDKTPFVKTHASVISVYVHAVADVSNVNGTIHGITLTDNENNSVEQGNIADVLIPFNATAQEPESTVPLTWDATAKTATLTNKMPAGNVTVTAEYFPQATAAEGALTAATGVAATTSEPLVTLDASKLTGATKLMYLTNKSTDPAPGYDAQGWSDKLPTADSFTEGGGYNVYYYPLGTDDADPAKTFSDGDICASPILVSLDAAPTYSVTFAKDNPEPDKWSAEPNTGLTKGETVTVTYSGTRKVLGVKAEKKLDMRSMPLTVEALTAGTVKVSSPKSGMQYSKNGGAKTAMSGKTEIELAAGDHVAFYGNGTSITQYSGTSIGGSGDGFQVKVYGNIMSLVDETGFATATTLTAMAAFESFFSGNTTITDISNLVLPATELTQQCYASMFYGCKGLTALPADLLPATELAKKCYSSMFWVCTGLTTVPANFLPATNLAESCYNSMFFRCTGLTTVPADLLPATTLAHSCYNSMFAECSNLTAAPDLPAPALVAQCYARMFGNCSKLASIKCLALSDFTYDNLSQWVKSVAATGTFYAVSSADWPTDPSYSIPSGWNRVNIDN